MCVCTNVYLLKTSVNIPLLQERELDSTRWSNCPENCNEQERTLGFEPTSHSGYSFSHFLSPFPLSFSLPPLSLSHLTIMVILFKRKFPGLACKKLKSHHTIITTTKLSKLKNQHVLGPSEKRGLNWKGGHRETQRSGAEIGSRIFHGNQYRDRKI